MTQHNDVIRESFTTQAQAFAANPWVTDKERIRRLVAAARLTGSERVLDIATGPGYIAEAFAGATREVVGVDLIDAMLAIAKQRTQEHGISNVSFRAADAQNLPFENGAFDVVVCRLALHHLLKPRKVLREMARVCRARGTIIVVEDITPANLPNARLIKTAGKCCAILRPSAHSRSASCCSSSAKPG